MKKHISLLLLAGALTWGACDKAMEDNLPSEFASVLYFDLKDGKNIIDCKLLKTGDKGQYTFYVGKGGNQLGATAEAELTTLTEAELEDYNENNNSDYTLLPSKYYSFAEKLSFTGEDMRKGVDVMFETSNMDNELEADKQYVLPVRLGSQNSSVNQTLNLLIIKPFVTTPMVTLDLPEYQKISMYTYVEEMSETVSMPLIVDLNENKWTFTVTLEDDEELLQSAVDDYKSKHSDAAMYQLLPAANRSGLETPVTFGNGALMVVQNLIIDREGLKEGDYLLPIRLKGCSNEFDVNTKTMYIHLSVNSDLPEIELTREMVLGSISENTGESHLFQHMFDGRVDTYWQTRWQWDPGQAGFLNDPVYGQWLDIELKEPITIFKFDYQIPERSNFNPALGSPKEFKVYVGNSKDDLKELKSFTEADNLPKGMGEWFKSDNINMGGTYKYIRFGVTTNFGNNELTAKKGGTIWFAEFKLYGRNSQSNE